MTVAFCRWGARFVLCFFATLPLPALAQSESPLRDYVGQWMLSRQTCDAMRAGRIDTTGDEPVASIGWDGIVFAFGNSANVCRLRSARSVQGRLEGRFACVDEQNQAENITLTLALQGRRLALRKIAPERGGPETWWFCSPLDPGYSVVSGNVTSAPSAQARAAPGAGIEQRALAALADELREAEQFGGQRPRTRITTIDLNGDGQLDALVTIFSGYYGARGCSTEIIELRAEGARRLGGTIACELRASGRGPTGWLDLTGGGSKIWRYDGTTYR